MLKDFSLEETQLLIEQVVILVIFDHLYSLRLSLSL